MDNSLVKIVEEEDPIYFELKVEELLKEGYKISASSCNSKLYKTILIKGGQYAL